MAGKELYPSIRDERKTFRFGTNRMVELTLRHELDDVAKKSVDEIIAKKEMQKHFPLDQEQLTTRHLLPAFSPRKVKEKRKTEPVFHEDLQNKDNKKEPGFMLVPNVPAYNPLDKLGTVPETHEPTKRFPYSKEETFTTVDLQKPRVTSMGVLPLRTSFEIPSLKVMMEGRPVLESRDPALEEMEEANQAHPGTPGTPDETFRGTDFGNDVTKQEEPKKKPAILGSEGTSAKVVFAVRPPPQPHPSTIKRRRLAKSGRSLASSLKSQEIVLPDETVYQQYDDAIAAIDNDLENIPTVVGDEQLAKMAARQSTLIVEDQDGRRSGAVSSAAKSVKDLLDEAKKISTPGTEPIYKQRRKSPRKKDGKKDLKKSGKGDKGQKGKEDDDNKEMGIRSERTVDEIIASLRSQSRVGQTQVTTEADRRIQEIMDRVMSRASGSSGADAESKKEIDIPSTIEEGSGPGGSPALTSTPQPREGVYGTPSLPSPVLGESPITSQSSPLDMDKKDMEKPDIIVEEKSAHDDDEQDKREAEKYMEERRTANAAAPNVPQTTVASAVEPLQGLNESEDEEEEEEQTQTLDIRKAWEDLSMPDATYEELVGVEGKSAQLEGRHPNLPAFKEPVKASVHSNSVSFLSAWKPAGEKRKREEQEPSVEKPQKSVHHFCKMTTEYQLPEQFWHTGRKYHTPSRFQFAMPDQKYRFGPSGPTEADGPAPVPVPRSAMTDIPESREEEEGRISAAARRVLQEVEGTNNPDETLEAWEKRAQEVFELPQITVEGTAVPLLNNESRLYWDPAPPKLDVAPGKVKDILFPEYQQSAVGGDIQELHQMMEESSESEDEIEEEEMTEEDRERQEDIQRVLDRRHTSCEDLTDFIKDNQQREQDIADGKINPYASARKQDTDLEILEKVLEKDKEKEGRESRGTSKQQPRQMSNLEKTSEKFYYAQIRRTRSMEDMTDFEDDTLVIPQDYNTVMEEIGRQKRNIRQMKVRKRMLETQQFEEPVEDETIENLKRVEPEEYEPPPEMKAQAQKKSTIDEPTPAEQALAAGRAYVILPKRKKKKRRENVNMQRLDDIESFLRKKPKQLQRSESMIRMAKPIERELRVSSRIREGTKRSMPNIFDFEGYGKKKGLKSVDDTREWTRAIWNTWFDEVYPPTPDESEEEEEPMEEEMSEEKMEDEKKKKRKDSLTSSVSEGLQYIEPLVESEENLEVHQILAEEIEKLTEDMNATAAPKAFDFSRRGALYRKIGYLKAADDDLSTAITMEPLMLDAYWHRHLLYVLQDKKKEALDDLNFILKHTKQHSGAYRSMAEIYRREGDLTMAIVNYNQATKLNPQDHEAFFRRAECYEKRGDMLLALENYSLCTKICPTRTDAILKHGMYYFNNRSWNNAINDFTDLLRVDPLNSSARVLRGRAYSSQGQWSSAVEDLSAAIHLNPTDWMAFYHRACILRKAHPKRALQDYSVSLMLNDSEENIMSYLHRGILYNAMNKPEDAIPDFESVLKLNKDIACAHVNLGLIMMKHYDNYHRAIKRFSSAIKVDPTYVRAYVCRGEAYHKIHELKLALRDFTRAIHLRPDVHHYYMYRGQLVLEMGNLDLAAFCVRHASEIGNGSSMGQKPTQQAVVQSFLKNYDKAIEALKTATRSKPVASMFMLLGKTQMKAKQFQESIISFEEALKLYKPWKSRDPWPVEAADSHYLIGQCHMELRNYLEALESFSSAIKLNSSMAEALYQRGMARMKLKMSKGIQDFNRALAINPKIFQAYLSRACFYGMKGLYTKAILNCNEAIRLQPMSVRAYLYRGALKYHIKAFELAIKDLSKATSIDSTCPLAFFNRAVCFQEDKQYQKALTDYGIVLLLGEQLKLKVLINRGLLYFEQKDYINALYDFRMAAKLNPSDHHILHTLGLCYHKLNRLPEAVEVFGNCIKQKPFFLDGIIARGNVYMDYGHEGGLRYAMRDYQRVLKLDPLCLPARVNLAYTLQVSGLFTLAWRQFTTAIDLKPSYKPALEGRAIINLQMSDTFASYQDITASIRVSPTAELLTNRGVIHQFMGDRVNSMRDYQEALQLDSTYSLAYFNAGNVYFHNRHFTLALDYFSKSINFNPKDESALLNRAITKVMLKDAPGALEDFRAALKLSPHSAHMYFNRGNLYASMQQFDKAERDYSKALDIQPDDSLMLRRRADVRGKLGQKDKAIADYRRAIEIQGRRRAE